MAIKFPQLDLPNSTRGDSDAFDHNLAGDLLSGDFFSISTYISRLKVWDGSIWNPIELKIWNGSDWVIKPLKKWNGSQWELV